MKKIIAILLILAFCASTPAYALWDTVNTTAKGKVRVFRSDNNSANVGAYGTTVVSPTCITVGSKIVGISVGPYDVAYSVEAVVGLYDIVTDRGYSIAECVAEAEVGDAGPAWFDYPVIVETSVTIKQGDNTTVLLHYVR